MKQVLLIGLFVALTQTANADEICANAEAREFAAKVLNAQAAQLERVPQTSANEVFARKYIVDDRFHVIQPYLVTIKDLRAEMTNSETMKRVVGRVPAWTVWWTFKTDLLRKVSSPRKISDDDKLTEFFCIN